MTLIIIIVAIVIINHTTTTTTTTNNNNNSHNTNHNNNNNNHNDTAGQAPCRDALELADDPQLLAALEDARLLMMNAHNMNHHKCY